MDIIPVLKHCFMVITPHWSKIYTTGSCEGRSYTIGRSWLNTYHCLDGTNLLLLLLNCLRSVIFLSSESSERPTFEMSLVALIDLIFGESLNLALKLFSNISSSNL